MKKFIEVVLATLLAGCATVQAPVETASCARLTIDDGPNALYTEKFLDVLKERNVKATFFVVGEHVVAHPEIIARMYKEGHRIGNHTWDHSHLTTLSLSDVREELFKTSDAIYKITRKSPDEWRPPYEEYNESISKEASIQGMQIALWTYKTDPNDWQGISPDKIADKIISNANNNSIIIMHDTYINSLVALPIILDGLKKKNICLQ